MNFNKNQIWSSFDHWVTRTIRPKLINLKSSMIKKSKMRFALHFPSWPLESHSFGLKYGHFRYHQLQKCPNSKNYFVKAQYWLPVTNFMSPTICLKSRFHHFNCSQVSALWSINYGPKLMSWYFQTTSDFYIVITKRCIRIKLIKSLYFWITLV